MRVHESYAIGWRVMWREKAEGEEYGEHDALCSDIAEVQDRIGELMTKDWRRTIVIAPVQIMNSHRVDDMTREEIESDLLAVPYVPQ